MAGKMRSIFEPSFLSSNQDLFFQDDVMNATMGRIGIVSGMLAAKGGLFMVNFKETKGLEYLGTKVFLRACLERVSSEELKAILM